jgi:putative endonuclease
VEILHMATDRTLPPKATTPRKVGTPRADPRSANSRSVLGAEGESRAAQFLERRGYRILARNRRLDGVEIDLIARRGRIVAFVEVKTRRSRRFGSPETAVDRAKQARIVRAARAWLHEAPRRSLRIRFDVVSCCVSGPSDDADWQIVHIESAFDDSD